MVFIEKQRLDVLWVKILMFSSAILAIMSMFISERKFASAEAVVWFTAFFIAGITGLIYYMIFEIPAYTKVDNHGIHYKYRPWVWNYKLIRWNEVNNVEIKAISPVADFGGWGYRFTFRKGNGIILNSKNAMVITKTNGKKMTITTDRKLELEKAIAQLQNTNIYNE